MSILRARDENGVGCSNRSAKFFYAGWKHRALLIQIGIEVRQRSTARGGKYVSESLAERFAGMVDNGRTRAPHERLSDREFEVLRALGSGMTVKDIADQLRLSAKTVSTYRVRLLEKMGLKSKADLVRYVVQHDLLK